MSLQVDLITNFLTFSIHSFIAYVIFSLNSESPGPWKMATTKELESQEADKATALALWMFVAEPLVVTGAL